MDRYDLDHAGAIAGSVAILCMGLVVLMSGAASGAAALAGMVLVLLAWLLLLYGVSWKPRDW